MFSYYQERCPQETSWLLPETCKYKLLLGNMTTITLLRPLRLFPNTGKKNPKKKQHSRLQKNSNKNSEPRLDDHSTGIQSYTKPLKLVSITTQQQKKNILNHRQLLATQKNSRLQQQQYNENNTTTFWIMPSSYLWNTITCQTTETGSNHQHQICSPCTGLCIYNIIRT